MSEEFQEVADCRQVLLRRMQENCQEEEESSKEESVMSFISENGLYQPTGLQFLMDNGSTAVEYLDPYNDFGGPDRNSGNEFVIWGIVIRTDTFVPDTPRHLFLIEQRDPRSEIPDSKIPEPGMQLFYPMIMILILIMRTRRWRVYSP